MQRYPLNVASPLDQKLGGVLGARTAAVFAKGFGIDTVGDLLTHYPRRYARRGELTELSHLPLDDDVTIVAEVIDVRERPMRAKKGSLLEARITDGKGILTLTFFNQPWRAKDLRPGVRGIFAGKVGEYRGSRQLAHPDYELFEEDNPDGPESAEAWAMKPIPIYPATSTVSSWKVQKAVGVALDSLGELDDPVPDAVRKSRGLLPFTRAIELIHRPTVDAEWRAARKSLRFQEAFVLQTALLEQRQRLKEQAATPRIPKPGGLLEQFDAALDFTLTADQREVGEAIANDIATPEPMNRLLQGEVGSGKTVVALRAMLAVADTGGQSALLAPTEVLAGQHIRSIVSTLGPDLAARVRPTLITGQLPTADRRKALLAAVTGQAQIVIGTHALMSQSVEFFDLGLVVVDEQHRFGVDQREALRRKGAVPPHVLVLTATPIPRTVAMTVFGDLDISTIAELPAGRIPIETFVVPLADRPGWEGRVWERLSEELEKGRQAFVVCPAIDAESDVAPAEPDGPVRPLTTVADTLDMLRADERLAGRRIEALHGRLASDEKDARMRAFAAGEIDVLVATTVIEVGVDVPNASAMIVLDADRFGVSQLHQLRGRVGRGDVPGLCLLVTAAEIGTPARERVEAVAATLDGFELAQKDLELRQEGDVLGSVQSGRRSSLRLLRVVKDGDLILQARSIAEQVLAQDPMLIRHPALRDALERRLDEAERDFLAKS
ncbi:MAG TPA: ATP-dependent DNA helicase RecG [Terrimesophilobacter sp.]|nr:ATP-dependent DNA helicase RecG [Terrimesophilobacter sp.]